MGDGRQKGYAPSTLPVRRDVSVLVGGLLHQLDLVVAEETRMSRFHWRDFRFDRCEVSN